MVKQKVVIEVLGMLSPNLASVLCKPCSVIGSWPLFRPNTRRFCRFSVKRLVLGKTRQSGFPETVLVRWICWLSQPVTITYQGPLLSKLGGFGVVFTADTDMGQLRTDRTCRSGHKHLKKTCPSLDSNPRTPGCVADILPVEPRQHVTWWGMVVEFCQNEAMLLHCWLKLKPQTSRLSRQTAHT